jgi:hypothetical protein
MKEFTDDFLKTACKKIIHDGFFLKKKTVVTFVDGLGQTVYKCKFADSLDKIFYKSKFIESLETV